MSMTKNFAHRLVRAGDRYYKYDANGNIICEQDGSFESNGEDVSYHKITQEAENVYSTDYGWGLFKENNSSSEIKGSRYCRTYTWNERNQLISSVDSNYSTAYVYGQDGQRSNKYTQNSETLYFNKMWTLHTDSGNNVYGGQSAKNIYLAETRIVTKLNSGENPTYQEEYYKQYFYHSDHLGSASLISDYKGDEYQRIEYTPYGETWVEKTSNTGLEFLPYKFTAKELDEETGLYYYGARYLDPKYSRWLSTDPALGDYIPGMGKANANDASRLPGMGGIYNTVNLHMYHYAGNNPIKYTDPDGRKILHTFYLFFQNSSDNVNIPMGKTPSGVYDPETKIVTKQNTIGDYGCLFTSAINVANDIKLRYCEKGAIGMPKNTIIPATSISAKANSDKYFTYQNNPNKHESDANMTINNIKQLIEDVSTRSVVIEEITGTSNIEKAIAELNNSSTDNGYIIAHCNGHFFNLTGIDSNPNKEKNLGYLYHDPYIRKTIKSIDNFRTKVNNGGIDKIFIIRIEE